MVPVSIFPSLPASAASCRVRHPRVARHGTCGAGEAPSSPVGFTRVDSHLPPCKVLLTAGADSEKWVREVLAIGYPAAVSKT